MLTHIPFGAHPDRITAIFWFNGIGQVVELRSAEYGVEVWSYRQELTIRSADFEHVQGPVEITRYTPHE